MSKIRAYLDTSVLEQIISGNFDLSKMSKVDFVTSIQAIMEFCIENNLQKKCPEIVAYLVNYCKIRSTDHEVLTKFNAIFNGPDAVKNIDKAPTYLHVAVALLESCEYFVTNEIIGGNFGIKSVTLSELTKELSGEERSQTLFDLL